MNQPAHDSPDNEQRLQQFLAAAGLGSRRGCEDLIRAGRISIDGETVTEMGVRVDPTKQSVEYDGERLKPQPKRYYMLNKPKGYLCTNSDPKGRPRVIDLFQTETMRLFTVGRLDEESEGLLIVTNDGDFSEKLAHPRYGFQRVYCVHVRGNPTQQTLQRLIRGLYFEEGKFRFHKVERLRKHGPNTVLQVTMTEGKNREIRRLLAKVGHPVTMLQRVAFGPLELGNLKQGEYRNLEPNEIKLLQRSGSSAAKPSGKKPTRKRSGPTGRSQASQSKPGRKRATGASTRSASKPPAKKSQGRTSPGRRRPRKG